MTRRKWKNEEKILIILQGLKGRPVADICTEFGVAQSQYYTWRDQFMNNAHRAFESNHLTNKEAKLRAENKQLKSLIGDLHLELKKSEEWL